MLTRHCQLKIVFVLLLIAVAAPTRHAHAQESLERVRANPVGPVEIFWAPSLVGTPTVTVLPQGSLDFTIMHTFGLARGGVPELFGLDGVANIRFGLDYSISNNVSLGLGRSRFDKLYDGRMKVALLSQKKRGGPPAAVSVMVGAAVPTATDGRFDALPGLDTIDKLSYFATAMIARQLAESLSLQIAPVWAHTNTAFVSSDSTGRQTGEENDVIALAMGARFLLTERLALTAEYVPVLTRRATDSRNAGSIGLEFDTGGHVFQVFITSVQWFTPQHMLARTQDDILAGDFRLGFNVHRVF